MLKIDRDNQTLLPLDLPTLSEASVRERYDLQEFICNSPTAFFAELGQELFLIGKEVQPSTNVQDRIDILAIDRDGTAVVVELKRGNHKLQLLQAISYAAMLSEWEANDFMSVLDATARDSLEDFLAVELSDINRQQRIVLVAESYDYALLKSAEWLSDQFGVDIRCCRISLSRDASDGREFLFCSNVYPAPELVEEAVARRRSTNTSGPTTWTSWDAALQDVENSHVVRFFRGELAAGRENYLPKRIIHFRVNGKRRWFLSVRSSNVYVWQQSRFTDDVKFWSAGLGPEARVEPVASGRSLRFFLSTEDHFKKFKAAATDTLLNADWLSRGEVPPNEIDDPDNDEGGA